MILRREAISAALYRAGRSDLAGEAEETLPLEVDTDAYAQKLHDLGVDPMHQAGGGVPALLPGFSGNTDGT